MIATTLNEPVLTTIKRDAGTIATKLYHVLLLPTGRSATPVLRQWDLWGPLLLCVTLATTLQLSAPPSQAHLIFATVFVVVWVGAGVVTVNAQLLGGTVSFFQSVCVLGYCMFPLVIAALVTHVLNGAVPKVSVTIGCLVWAILASRGFLTDVVPQNRKFLATYPIALFYAVVSWMILVGN